MQNFSCKLNIPLGPGARDLSLEADLQSRIDDGHKVYAIGDIHGHLATFRALLHRLRLGKQDRVVCLGEVIERGLGPEQNRSRPQLPSPHSFTFYYWQNRSYPSMMQSHIQKRSLANIVR